MSGQLWRGESARCNRSRRHAGGSTAPSGEISVVLTRQASISCCVSDSFASTPVQRHPLSCSKRSVCGKMCLISQHFGGEGRRERQRVSQCGALAQSPPCPLLLLLLRVSPLLLLQLVGMPIASAPHANVCSAHMLGAGVGACAVSNTHWLCVSTGVICFFPLLVP